MSFWKFHLPDHPLHVPYKWARRIVISVVGITVLGAGIAMVVLPGPALIVIPLGLAILGIGYAWARAWLRKAKEKGQQLSDKIAAMRKGPE